jgi:hypothetical protein
VKASYKRKAIWIEIVGKQLGQDKNETIKAISQNLVKPGGQENLMQQQLYLDILMIHCKYFCKSTGMLINDTRFRQV